MSYALVLVLLVLRRFRHMIIWLILTTLLALIGSRGPVASGRGRSESRSGRAGAAGPCRRCRSPSSPSGWWRSCTARARGRWRNTGKWVVTALVALNALGRMALGADAPTDVLVGVALE